jgi:hypothetical protein
MVNPEIWHEDGSRRHRCLPMATIHRRQASVIRGCHKSPFATSRGGAALDKLGRHAGVPELSGHLLQEGLQLLGLRHWGSGRAGGRLCTRGPLHMALR